MNTAIAIEHNPKNIQIIEEMIENRLNKLNTFVKSKERINIEDYYEFDAKFNEIALKLENYEFLNDELDYFLSIIDKILYILYQNCKDNTFGHCDFALELFDFFMTLWKSKLKLLKDFSDLELENYEKLKIQFKRRYGKYRHNFYLNIHKSSEEYTEKEIYKIHEKLRFITEI